jgi:uncharacterized membrane protein
MTNSIKILWLSPILLVSSLTACNSQKQVSFKADVAPILQARCMECHNKDGEGFKASGLNFETYADVMKGTRFGPVIKAGDSVSSTLMRLIEGKADPSINMPHGNREPLTAQEIQTIKSWINAGAMDN